MTDNNKPRKVIIIDKKPAGFNPDEDNLLMPPPGGDSGDDQDLYDPTSGIGPDGHFVSEEMDEEQFLYDIAVEWLPQLPQIDAMLGEGIALDYGVLVSASIVADEFQGIVDDETLDDMIATLLLYGEEDPENRLPHYEGMTASGQELAIAFGQVMQATERLDLSGVPLDARQLLFAAVLSDVEVAGEVLAEMDEQPGYDDMQTSAKLMTALSAPGDIPLNLIKRASIHFNTLADKAELELDLAIEGRRVVLKNTPPAHPAPPSGRPPRP